MKMADSETSPGVSSVPDRYATNIFYKYLNWPILFNINKSINYQSTTTTTTNTTTTLKIKDCINKCMHSLCRVRICIEIGQFCVLDP